MPLAHPPSQTYLVKLALNGGGLVERRTSSIRYQALRLPQSPEVRTLSIVPGRRLY